MVGNFAFDGQCVASKTCCCGNGPLSVAANTSHPGIIPTAPSSASLPSDILGAIILSSSFDGGIGCFGFTALAAIFAIDTPTTAYYETAGIR
jgi:hypothetical protein